MFCGAILANWVLAAVGAKASWHRWWLRHLFAVVFVNDKRFRNGQLMAPKQIGQVHFV